MSEFKLDIKEEGDVVVITTEGYLNNVGGEKIAEACYEKIEDGKNYFLLNKKGEGKNPLPFFKRFLE